MLNYFVALYWCAIAWNRKLFKFFRLLMNVSTYSAVVDIIKFIEHQAKGYQRFLS
jgi:hypothetical protein